MRRLLLIVKGLAVVLTLCQTLALKAQTLASAVRIDTPSGLARQSQNTENGLSSLLAELEKRYDVSIAYDYEVVQGKYVESALVLTAELEDNLRNILKPFGLEFKRIEEKFYVIQREEENSPPKRDSKPSKRLKGIRSIFFNKRNSEASPLQDVVVTGRVTDERSDPIPGVNVIVKGTTTGTVTNADGKFTLSVATADAILIFSSIGFVTREVVVGSRTTIDVILSEDIKKLEEVVVVGYGTQKRSDLTGSVASIPKSRLENVPNNNPVQALQGAMPGVSIVQNSGGAEGNDFSILVRGRNSIRANNAPLVILDGIPYAGSLSDINPQDIESIEVLKDASSAAIYGSRASNGVILITTLKGKSPEPVIEYDGFYGIMRMANLPDLMSGEQFYDFKVEREPDQITVTEENNHQAGKYADWVELATRPGMKQQHTLSFNGKFNKTSLYVSGSLLDVEGIALNDQFRRYSTRFNIEQGISDWLKIGTNTQLALSDRSGVPVDFEDAFFMNPLTNPYNEDGTLSIYPWPEDIYWHNPLSRTLIQNKDNTYSVFSNNYVDADLKFVKGLSFRLNTGVEYASRRESEYVGIDTKQGFERRGEGSLRNVLNLNFVVENILRYQLSLGEHKFDLTGLYSFQNGTFNSNRIYGQGFDNDILTVYQMNLAEFVSVTTDYSKETLISQMGRLNYNFDNRYLVTLTARRDGYSGFGRNQKYGIFPSVALGWNISGEPFFESLGVLSFLKLRTSYGKNGNQAVGAYNTLPRMNSVPYLNGPNTAPGFIPGSLENNNLGWETTTAFNVGLDYGLFDDRLSGSINYYHNITSDLLLERSISTIHGHQSIIQNIGKTQNTGFELDLNAEIFKRNTFQWHADVNFSVNRNKILELATDEDDILNQWFIGRPIDVNYDLVFDGVFQETDDIASSAQPNAEPGHVKVLDVNDDGQINGSDRTFIGSLQPDFFWGMMHTFTYKNFSLNVFLQGIQGVTRLNVLRGDDPAGDDARKRFKMNTMFWTPENPINTYWANDANANPFRVGIYEDASFLRVKDITLTYNFPQTLTSRLGMEMIRTYFNVRNALTVTGWTGLDPELSAQRAIPLQREFVLGLNFQF